jgi:hypothetical protein
MRAINTPDPQRALPTRVGRPRNDEDRSPERRTRRQLIAEAVIASYIHDISVRHSAEAAQTEIGVRT